MTKIKHMAAMVMLGILFLSGCGGSDVAEIIPCTVEQIQQDMEEKDFATIWLEGDGYFTEGKQLTIETLVLENRTTQGQTDEVSCSFVMSNDSYKVEGDYNCCYEFLGEEGWQLKSASTENVQIEYIGDTMPEEIEEALNAAYFDDYQIVNTESIRLEDGGIEVTYFLDNGKQYFRESGEIKITYRPACRSDLNYDAEMPGYDMLTCYWTHAQENSGMEEEWDIVGTYTGSAYDGMYSCELVIDSFDPEQQEIHVAYAKYVSTGFHDGISEVSDVTLSYEVWEGSDMTDFDVQLMFTRSRTEISQLLRIEDDDAFYGSVRIKRVE